MSILNGSQYPIFLYTIFIILTVVLLVYLYHRKIEGTVTIMLLVFTTLMGYQTLYDLSKNEDSLYISLNNWQSLVQQIPPLNLLTLLLFNMISVLLFTVAFFVVLILFYYKTVSKDSVIALGCILATIITTLLVQDLTTKIPYYAIYSIPIILLIVSMILMTVAISNFNEFGRLPLSKKHEKDFKKYKDSLVTTIVFIIASLITATCADTTNFNMKKNLDKLMVIFFIIIYSVSGNCVYTANEMIEISRNKIQ